MHQQQSINTRNHFSLKKIPAILLPKIVYTQKKKKKKDTHYCKSKSISTHNLKINLSIQ